MRDMPVDFPRIRATLEDLVRIPGVSATDPAAVRRSAEAVAALFADAGVADVSLLEVPDAHPAVFAEIPGPEGAPTVLLYAHHDVQPAGPGWERDAFEPIVEDGRLFGRGSADDKAGIVVHLASVLAFDGAPPVTLKIFIEGEEEIGSPHLPAFLETYRDRLAADVIVIADAGNWAVGVPSFTTSLRGLVDCVVEVRTADHAVHSGMFGGAVPDAITALAHTLASLHHPDGRVAVAGLVADDDTALDYAEADLRQQVGTVAGLELIGTGSLASRLWQQPAVTVIGIDAPTTAEAANALIPVASAKVSLRIAPGQDAAEALRLLGDHLIANAPWGAEVTVHPGAVGEAIAIEATGPAYDAWADAFRTVWDREPVSMGVGGSIPMVAALTDTFPDAAILLTGVGDPTSNIHGPDESVDLDDLERMCRAQILALRAIGRAT